jgi:excinuclease ABC subunit C
VLACHGPVAAGHLAREAVRRINDWYRLRDCPQQQAMVFAEQRDLFAEPGAAGCLRYDIGTCLGPCAGLCGRTDYAAQVQAARRFLLGQDGAPVAHLEQAMAQAAADQQFERAAGLRDQLGALQWLVGQLAEVRRIRAACSFVYPVTGHDQRELWYVIHGARVEAVVPRPATAAEERHLAATVKAVRRNRHPADGIMEGVERDAVLLLGAWFRQHPDELAKARPLDAVG